MSKDGNGNRSTTTASNAQAQQPSRETQISDEESRSRVRFRLSILNIAFINDEAIPQEHMKKGSVEHVHYNYNQVHELMKKWILLDNQLTTDIFFEKSILKI